MSKSRWFLGLGALSISAAVAGCNSPPRLQAPTGDAVVLVTPETGPSALQRYLSAMKPAKPAATGSIDRLDAALDLYHDKTQAHRAYIAVDKPLYQPGETVWFRTFDLFSASLAGDANTYGTTFQLISPKGAAVIEKRVMTRDGASANDFQIPEDVPGGEYVISAVTDQGTETKRNIIVASYQAPRIKKKLEFLRKAYGPSDKVAAAIALHRATGEALAKKQVTGLVNLDGAELTRVPVTTDADGNAIVKFELPAQISKGDGLLTILVDDGGITESIQKRIPITLNRLQLAMFPEGGDLVAGLPGRVYFLARNLIDKPADVEGTVVDDSGRVVAKLRSHYNGMGRFELHPEPGRTYKVKLTRPSGISQTFRVPKPAQAGCSMHSIDDYLSKTDDIRVAVWCTKARKVIATAVLRGARLGTSAAVVEPGQPSVIALPAPDTDQGAVRVTLLSSDLDPLAERLVYRNRKADLKIAIKPHQDSYNPRDKVVLDIEARTADGSPAKADLAVSVVDDTVLSFADDKTAHVMARLYLESEMPGQKIEEPNFYFSDDPKAAPALDMVLGTQGWRRFDWELVFVPPEPIVIGWDFTGEYWSRPDRDKDTKNAEEQAEKNEPPGDARAVRKPRKGNKEGKRKRIARRLDAARQQVEILRNAPAPAEEMAVYKEDDDWGGDMVVMRERGRLGGGFDDRGFDVGGEGKLRKNRIRDEDWGDQNEVGRNWNWAPARQFPVPNYAQRYDGPRLDFRETVYWAPQIETGDDGKAQVSFYLSDAVTSFRATAEGFSSGQIGRGDALVTSKLPVSLAVKMPVEVSMGDRIRLPITVANETDRPHTARITTAFGAAFDVSGDVPSTLELSAGQRKSMFVELSVVGNGAEAADGKAVIAVEAANLKDEVERTIRVVPRGFPQQISISGTIADAAVHEFEVTDVLPNTMSGLLTMYPSPVSTMVSGTDSMIREPTGCFEQASSANYPNIMILGYLEEHDAADPALVEKTQSMLDRGYKMLAGYESPNKGYEWFGGDPGHEALTAYGLMEFVDMKSVYDDVDDKMVARTARWLKKRRDGKGGYMRNSRALDSFGSASPEVTDAYITYALTEAKTKGINTEIAAQRRVAKAAKDPYIMALATNTLLNVEPRSAATRSAVKRLIGMQKGDGSFSGANHSITRSGGVALNIETTALAALAMMAAGDGHRPRVERAINWLNDNRNGFGGYGSTQSTVLALKAMSEYVEHSRVTQASGKATVYVNDKLAGTIDYKKGHKGTLDFDLAGAIRRGKNTIRVQLDSEEPLPYSMLVTWSSKMPATSPEAKVSIGTELARTRVPMGEGVKMKVRVKNVTPKGIPMVLARVGLPGGLSFQTWQLKELRDKKLIDFYETREREVILYFRSMAPNADKRIDLELKADVPGTYTAPASRAYLYYTDEHKHWTAPERVTVVK